MLEQKRWIFHLEFARIVLIGLLVWLNYPYFNLTVFLLLLAGLFLLFYRTISSRYYSYLYRY